ncbi:hypothetical protein B0H11DRAFT_2280811 [Mycena galericulata]|nr:hypothetical protein B0H11DRAFT_2280811 [Mycena galericulata]
MPPCFAFLFGFITGVGWTVAWVGQDTLKDAVNTIATIVFSLALVNLAVLDIIFLVPILQSSYLRFIKFVAQFARTPSRGQSTVLFTKPVTVIETKRTSRRISHGSLFTVTVLALAMFQRKLINSAVSPPTAVAVLKHAENQDATVEHAKDEQASGFPTLEDIVSSVCTLARSVCFPRIGRSMVLTLKRCMLAVLSLAFRFWIAFSGITAIIYSCFSAVLSLATRTSIVVFASAQRASEPSEEADIALVDESVTESPRKDVKSVGTTPSLNVAPPFPVYSVSPSTCVTPVTEAVIPPPVPAAQDVHSPALGPSKPLPTAPCAVHLAPTSPFVPKVTQLNPLVPAFVPSRSLFNIPVPKVTAAAFIAKAQPTPVVSLKKRAPTAGEDGGRPSFSTNLCAASTAVLPVKNAISTFDESRADLPSTNMRAPSPTPPARAKKTVNGRPRIGDPGKRMIAAALGVRHPALSPRDINCCK